MVGIGGWEHHEISETASFSAVELVAELGLLMLELDL